MLGPHPYHAGFVLFYLLALIGVGALKAGKIKSQADFSLAGRGLSTFVLIGTLLATWIGTGSIFGNAEEAYRVGLAGFWLPTAGVIGIVALYFLAGRIRRFEQFTIQDILEARFGVAARLIGTVTLMLAYVIIVSYQYRAGATVLGYLWPDLPTEAAVCGVALFVIVYTALAGMYSVAYTDVANGILIVIGIACALPILLSAAGGVGGVTEALAAEQREPFGDYFAPINLTNVLLPVFLLMLGDANMYQRFFSARSPAAARTSAIGMLVGVALLECAIIAVAVVGAGLVGQGVVEAPANPAHIVVHLAFEELPQALGVLLIGTIVAVVVSTADSYLLSPSTSLVRDVYQRFFNPSADGRHMVNVGRAVVVALGLVALGLAFTSDEFFRVALFAYTIYGAGITPVVLAAFFWPRATARGAVACMLTGVGTALAWRQLMVPPDDGVARLEGWASGAGQEWLADLVGRLAGLELDAVLPAAVVSAVVLVVVSLLDAPPDAGRARAV